MERIVETSEAIKELEEQLSGYMSEIDIKESEYFPYIVEVGALTVGTDDFRAAILQNVNYPQKFSEEAVRIIQSMKFSDGSNNPILPKIYKAHEWYRIQIERLKTTIDVLRKLEEKE